LAGSAGYPVALDIMLALWVTVRAKPDQRPRDPAARARWGQV
jgi:hypothetical protein